MTKPKIINRGRGPEIEGTRITVYDIWDYAREGDHHTYIAAALNISQPTTISQLQYQSDSGFVTVLSKRTEAAGWQQRVSTSALPPEELVAMKLNALLVDVAVLGDEGWGYLERVCGMLPDLGVIINFAIEDHPE